MSANTTGRDPARRSRRAVLAVGAGVAVLVAGGAGYLLTRPSGHPHRAAAPTPVAVVPTPVATPPAPVAVAPRHPAAPPHEYVRQAAPTSFTFTGRRFTIKAHVCGMADVRPLDPPGEQHHTVCWVEQGFGVAPGSRSATTYVLGHSWGQDDQEVLNKASEPATREILRGKPHLVDHVPVWSVHALDGYTMVLHTGAGTLTYTVRDAFGVHKNQAGFVRHIMNEKVPNRIVLLTCAELNHVDYEYNVVVDAYLTSSVRAVSTA